MESVNYEAAQTTLDDVYAVSREYREAMRPIRDALELEPQERLAVADEVFDSAAQKQQKVIDRFISERAERRDDLTRQLYQGGVEFNNAVLRFALASNDELDRVADLARRTDSREMLRAAAVVAREKGHSRIFHDMLADDAEFGAAFTELDDLGDERDDAAQLRPVAVKPLGQPGGPTVEDITPSQVDRAEARQREIDAAARKAHHSQNRGVRLVADEARENSGRTPVPGGGRGGRGALGR
jgi:hypothetical protein